MNKISVKKYRPVITTVIALLFYTTTDILIWQRIFEANNMVHYADTYHTGWFVTLVGYAVLGLVWMWGAWKDCLYFLTSLFVSAFSGLEDVLYYVLDGKTMPDSLPWLSDNPLIIDVSRNGVIGSVFLWFGVLILLYFVLYEWQGFRRKQMSDAQA